MNFAFIVKLFKTNYINEKHNKREKVFMRTDNLKSSKICSACYSERATAIEESCDTNRFFTFVQNDEWKKNSLLSGGRAARKFSRPPLRAQGHILRDSSLTFRVTEASHKINLLFFLRVAL